jgi:biotin transport system substrate-specific component
MEINLYIDKYRNIRYNFFKWRYETNYVNKLFLAFGFTLLTAILAQVKFYLPGNALVPITGQTFAVLLAGVILGRWGGISQCMYVGLGTMGLPWFANVTGSTIGYLIGFIIAAFFLGIITDKYIKSRSFSSMLLLMLFTTFALIYIPGLTYLYFYMSSLGVSLSLFELLTIAVIPFIAGDLIKAVAAASIAKAITPKKSYGREADTV